MDFNGGQDTPLALLLPEPQLRASERLMSEVPRRSGNLVTYCPYYGLPGGPLGELSAPAGSGRVPGRFPGSWPGISSASPHGDLFVIRAESLVRLSLFVFTFSFPAFLTARAPLSVLTLRFITISHSRSRPYSA